MNKRGVALILISILLVVLTIFSTALISSSFSENAFALRYLESTQAFWLSEAGIDAALNSLRGDPSLTTIYGRRNCHNYSNVTCYNVTTIDGGFNVTIYNNSDGSYTVNSTGFIPFNALRANRVIQAEMNLTTIPDNFYDTVIWSENDINIRGSGGNPKKNDTGNLASVNGSVISGGGIYPIPKDTNIKDIITGNFSRNDSTASPLPLLDFTQLRYISQNQYNSTTLKNNYYDAQRLSKNPTFPDTFWYNETAGIPNIVFLEGDLSLSGGDNVGGFFIVGGDSIYTYNTTISGNVGVDGCIYTPGNILIVGGGSNLNIDGGIWAGSVTLNGSITLSYNQTYAQAINNTNVSTIVQITSWKDLNNVYKLD